MEDSPAHSPNTPQPDEWQRHDAAVIRGANAVQLANVVGLDFSDDDSDHTVHDGRTLRRTRNREAVIVALVGLIREGELEPNVADIADRAGVSHRSVFRYFDDLSDLVRTAIDYEVNRALPLAVIPEVGTGSLERRVDALVDARLRVYAATHEVGRVARIKALSIPAIDESLTVIAGLNRTQMRNHFEVELKAVPDAQAEFIMDAAMVLTSFESYDTHRRIFQHGTERIRLVWNNALLALYRTEQ